MQAPDSVGLAEWGFGTEYWRQHSAVIGLGGRHPLQFRPFVRGGGLLACINVIAKLVLPGKPKDVGFPRCHPSNEAAFRAPVPCVYCRRARADSR